MAVSVGGELRTAALVGFLALVLLLGLVFEVGKEVARICGRGVSGA